MRNILPSSDSRFFLLRKHLTRHGTLYTMVFLFLLSVILSTICFLLEPTISRDGFFYLELIREWIQGRNPIKQHYLPPLPLYLTKLLSETGLSPEIAGICLNIFFSGGLPLIIYWIALEVTSERKIALWSAIFMMLNPSRIALSIEVQRDILYLFFCGLLIAFLISGIRRRKWFYWSLGGICFACSFLSRYETLEFIPILFFILLAQGFRAVIPLKNLLGHALSFCAGCAVALLLLICTMEVQNYLFINYWRNLRRRWLLFEQIYFDRETNK